MKREGTLILFDAVIFGGGPAGLAAAITLARHDLRIGIVDRGRCVSPPGEALTSAGFALLRELGVEDAFRRGPHLPCHAYRAIWGSPRVSYLDGVRDPRGHPWLIDRRHLVTLLRDAALGHGARPLRFRSPVAYRRAEGLWTLTPSADEPGVTARFLIDATGRPSAVARRLGARRRGGERQIAVSALIRATDVRSEPILVEAVERGWWYSALSPGAGLVLTFFTDHDLFDLRRLRSPDGLLTLLQQAGATIERVRSVPGATLEKPQILSAGSDGLDRVCGEGWLAAGDAALAYDPLSGHGLTLALASGRDAARAVCGVLAGDADAPARYGERIAGARAAYERGRAIQYRAERRWHGSPFWERRNGSVAAAPIPIVQGSCG